MLKILHARLQHYVNRELPDVQAGFRKGRGTRDQIANIPWIIKKSRGFQKSIYLCFIEYTKAFVWSDLKAFDCVDHSKLWKTLKEMGIPDHLTCLLRKLYAGQEGTVRILYGTIDWFRIEKGVWQGCLLSLCLFNLDADHILRYASWRSYKLESRLPGEISTTSDIWIYHSNGRKEEELKSLLMRVKEESNWVGLKLNIKETKIMASSPITSWQIGGEKVEAVTDLLFLGSKITANGDCSREIRKQLLLGMKVLTKLDSVLKSKDTTLLTKVCIVKAVVFPVVMYSCESRIIKKAEHWRIDASNCGAGEDSWDSLGQQGGQTSQS